jgi:hypothetical protein
VSNNDTSTLQLLAESMDEVHRCTCLLFNEAQTYPELCWAVQQSTEMMRDYERRREGAWMINLNRVLGKQEARE